MRLRRCGRLFGLRVGKNQWLMQESPAKRSRASVLLPANALLRVQEPIPERNRYREESYGFFARILTPTREHRACRGPRFARSEMTAGLGSCFPTPSTSSG